MAFFEERCGMGETDIDRRFDYHAPNEEARKRHESIRAALKNVAYLIAQSVPEGRERSLSLTHLEEAMFWANAGIARNHDIL